MSLYFICKATTVFLIHFTQEMKSSQLVWISEIYLVNLDTPVWFCQIICFIIYVHVRQFRCGDIYSWVRVILKIHNGYHWFPTNKLLFLSYCIFIHWPKLHLVSAIKISCLHNIGKQVNDISMRVVINFLCYGDLLFIVYPGQDMAFSRVFSLVYYTEKHSVHSGFWLCFRIWLTMRQSWT